VLSRAKNYDKFHPDPIAFALTRYFDDGGPNNNNFKEQQDE